MSGRGHVVEWVETTEEVVASEECPPDTDDPSAVLTVTEHADTPIHKLLDTMVQGEDPEDDGFYCVECRALFQGQVEYHGVDGPSFILDSPTTMGSPQRALLTLPHGLMIGRSSIPSAGLGVINQGPTVFPGMHFGPYEGEPATAEVALQSDFSWEISKGKDEYEYIDAARDSHSNWMRYVNCARSEEESNLLAVQYKDSILFHCCRSIQPGDELMVWPSGQLLSRFSHTWAQIWFLKCTQTESNTGAVSQVFLCAQCPLSFTTEAYLQRHTDHVHSQPTQDCTAAPGIEAAAAAPGHPPPVADTDDPQQASLLVLTVDPVESKMCSECGRTFKHVHHLKRHKLSVHSNERPYCCTQCRRCFSQASGLLRHQLVHKKQKMVEKMVKEACTVASRTTHLHETTKESEPTGAEDPAEAESVREETDASPNVPQEETDASPNVPQEETDASPNVPQEETDASPNFPQKETDANLNFPQEETDASPNIPQEETDTSPNVPQEEADENPNSPLQKADSDPNIPRESSDEQSHKCSHCDKIFTCEGSLTKHKRSVHSRIRPYVCTVCLQGFRQYSDLTRHLKTHQKGKGRKRKAGGEPTTFVTVYCDKCLLTFSSDDSLRRHLSQHHPEETSQVAPVDDRERSPLPSLSDGNRDPDPDFIAPPSVAAVAAESTGRPQRLAARSKISAIIKMMAPKRRLSVGKKTEENRGEVEAKPGASTQIDGGVTVAKLGRYGCSRCEGAYRNPADLRAHECAEKRHKCAQCSSTFKTSGFLKRHERMVHSVATPYICERCNRTFGKVCTLKQHQKANRCEKHHCSSELFRCPFCQFSFTLKSYLRKHIKRHHPVEFLSHSESDRLTCELGEEEAGESYNCPHCGKTYVNVKYFKAHMCFKQVRILYLCTDCGKGFANHYGLRQHQRIHTGEKPYSCPHCSKSFSYMGQVNVHIRTHTGEKPYLCTHCGESFRQSGDLKRHERKHTGVRPYSCPEVGCCKSFSRPQSLKAHQLLHLGQRMFKCTQCGKSFSRNYHLRRHHQKMHS